jgi:hypothetical protein
LARSGSFIRAEGNQAFLSDRQENTVTITTILLSGAAVLALGVAATFLAPREVEVRRSMIIDTTPAEVLAFAASTEVHQTCNSYRNEKPRSGRHAIRAEGSGRGEIRL